MYVQIELSEQGKVLGVKFIDEEYKQFNQYWKVVVEPMMAPVMGEEGMATSHIFKNCVN